MDELRIECNVCWRVAAVCVHYTVSGHCVRLNNCLFIKYFCFTHARGKKFTTQDILIYCKWRWVREREAAVEWRIGHGRQVSRRASLFCFPENEDNVARTNDKSTPTFRLSGRTGWILFGNAFVCALSHIQCMLHDVQRCLWLANSIFSIIFAISSSSMHSWATSIQRLRTKVAFFSPQFNEKRRRRRKWL